ncbi:DUF547 domain-containing protein [Lacinutrix salivirga]
MKNIFFLILVFIGSFSVSAQDINTFFSDTSVFMKANVANGKVDYDAIAKNPEQLHKVLKLAEGIQVAKTDAKNYQAFWINAYNLSVIKGIIDNYPIKSPLDKAGFFDKKTHSLAGKSITLNDIENKLLRAQFNDARVHFVLVCGAIGCPPLISEAYTPDTLEQQLQQQTELALNNPNFIKVKKGKVQLSEIFKWYKADFIKNGNEINYINQFRENKLESNAKVTYYTYNWNLNKK